MRFSALLSLAAAFAVITAFTIPVDQPNGVYAVSNDANGQETHELLNSTNTKRSFDIDLERSNTESPITLGIRGATVDYSLGGRNIEYLSFKITCLPNEGLINPVDNGASTGDLENQCGNGANVPGGRDFYAIHFSSVAYFCNLKSNSQICTSTYAANAFKLLNDNCGYSVPGYVLYTYPDGRDQYGYENFASPGGQKFCNRGVNGKI